MTRKGITQKNQLIILKRDCQAECVKCHEMYQMSYIHMDHIHPDALGGSSEPGNIQLLCLACHDVKTRGSGATTSGSDIGEIAKTKRLEKGPKEPKGNIRNRGFDKSLHKSMTTGKVTKR